MNNYKEELYAYIAGGWTIEHETKEKIELTKSGTTTGGHIFMFLTLGAVSLGLFNYLHEASNKLTKVIKK